jgi:hypothetical protein
MRQKMFAFGDDFTVKDEQDRKVFSVDGKMFRLRDTLLFKDAEGREIYKIQEKLRVRDSMDVKRDGRQARRRGGRPPAPGAVHPAARPLPDRPRRRRQAAGQGQLPLPRVPDPARRLAGGDRLQALPVPGHLRGQILAELKEVRGRDVIRLLDLLFVARDEAGQVTAAELSDLPEEDRDRYGALLGRLIDPGVVQHALEADPATPGGV